MHYSILIFGWKLVILLLTSLSLSHALQATPNSFCASICIDNPALSTSSSSSFNTFDTDLSCNNADYNTTAAGQKFEQCVNCLRTSNATDQGLNDQAMFLYNIRATLATCLYGFPNKTATINSPCNINYGCAPLQNAIENGINTTNGTQYSYCDADNGAFLGENFDPCRKCLHSSTDQTYLGNFLVALEAGCQQKPSPGQVISLAGDLFNSTWVTITTPPTPSPTPQPSTGLQTGAIVGIVSGALLALVGIPAFCILLFRQRRAKKIIEINNVESKLDERYGAQDISFPTASAYNPSSVKDRVIKVTKPVGTSYRPYLGYAAGKYQEIKPASQSTAPSGPRTNQQSPGSVPKYKAYPPNAVILGPSKALRLNPTKIQEQEGFYDYASEESQGLWSPYSPLARKKDSSFKA